MREGYRSGLEASIAKQIKSREGKAAYEVEKIRFVQPAKNRTYTPDFKLKNGLYVETKGRFTVSDRMKHLYIKDSNPNIEIRFVFTNPQAKLYKGAKSTYADWCDKYGFKYAKGEIPEEWFE